MTSRNLRSKFNRLSGSYEAGVLEDPSKPPPKGLWKLTLDPENAPEQGEDVSIIFEKGIPVALSFFEGGKEKVVKGPLALFLAANTLARRHGIGRVDIVENRFIGIKVHYSSVRGFSSILILSNVLQNAPF